MAEMRKTDEDLFETADYGKPYSTLTSYTPSAAWTWMVCGKQLPRIIAYNDM